MKGSRSTSRRGLKEGSDSGTTQRPAAASTVDLSWRQKFTANVLSCNLKRLRQRQQAKESPTDTSAEPHSAA